MLIKRLLLGVLWLCVAIVLVIGAQLLLAGASAIAGAGTFSNSIDSEVRFLATFWVAYGLMIIWVALNLRDRHAFIRPLMLTLVVSGLARALSIVMVGTPDQFYITGMIVEIVLGLLGLGLHQLYRHNPQ